MNPLLLSVGFLAGLLTIASPCILPVLPAVIASGVTSGGWRRAAAIASGLCVTFGAVELLSVRVLSWLHLPLGLREDVAVGVLALLGAGMLIPKIGDLIDRPFARLGFSRDPNRTRTGFGFGATLGLLYLPCAGPILAAIATVGNSKRNDITLTAVELTAAYCVGIALPMFALVLFASRASGSTTWLRSHAAGVRRVGGALILASAVVVATGAATDLQTDVPSYTASIENHLVEHGSVGKALTKIRNPHESAVAKRIQTAIPTSGSPNEFSGTFHTSNMADQVPTVAAATLPDYGPAPDFANVTRWLNTSGAGPTISSLRGKVVLIDFWTYSCINCLRSLPHVKAWWSRYRADGLEVIGVHTPEFDFEHSPTNVGQAVTRLGVTYPVDIDNDYGTWNAWGNNSWPAEYLIDRNGNVRYGSVGEGDYGHTEAAIRALLGNSNGPLPPATDVPDATPGEMSTPESYLGFERLARYDGTPVTHNVAKTYVPVGKLAPSHLSYGGNLTVQSQDVLAGPGGATIEINYSASDVYLVLSGQGTASVTEDGKRLRAVNVTGIPALYTLVSGHATSSGLLRVRIPAGVRAYDFTFG